MHMIAVHLQGSITPLRHVHAHVCGIVTFSSHNLNVSCRNQHQVICLAATQQRVAASFAGTFQHQILMEAWERVPQNPLGSGADAH